MNPGSIILELFSRKRLDRDAGSAALTFLFDYRNGAFEPEECGVYDPYEPFHRSEFDRYINWLETPGGEFGFRGKQPSFKVEGHILNLLFPQILTGDEKSPGTPMPSVDPPAFNSRWRLSLEPLPGSANDVELVREFFIAAAGAAGADYGFAADASDFKAKNFSSVREGKSVVEQYVGDNAEAGIPGLYWLNFFGDIYTKFFGAGKMANLAALMGMTTPPDDAFLLQFGQRPGDSISESVQKRQRQVVQALGDSAFFDIRRPDRILSVPPLLSRGS